MFNITENQRIRFKTKNSICSDDIVVKIDVQPELQEKSVVSNGTVTADSGYYGLSKVSVAVPLPEGNINLTTTASTNVYNYATAQIVDDNLVSENIKQGSTILTVAGSYDQPTLNSINISIANDVLSILNASDNGNFVSNYSIKSGSTVLTTITTTELNLKTLSLSAGNYTIGAIANGTNFHSSSLGTTSLYNVYSISSNISNGSITGETTISNTGTAIVTLKANDYYHLPETITVSNAEYTYNSETGVISLSGATGTVTISATCIGNTYSVTYNIKNGTITGSTSIVRGESITATITPDTERYLPESVTVENATSSYNQNTGVITITNPVGNVTVTVKCIEQLFAPSIAITDDTLSITALDERSTQFDIYVDDVYKVTINKVSE